MIFQAFWFVVARHSSPRLRRGRFRRTSGFSALGALCVDDFGHPWQRDAWTSSRQGVRL